MSVLKLLADQRPWFAIIGASAMFMWHSYVMRGLELEIAAERERKQKVVIEYREREAVANNDNVAKYQESIDDYRKKLDDMRRNGDIAIRLCKADATVHSVEAGNSAALAEDAARDNAELRKTILAVLDKSKKADAWMGSAWEFVNRE